MNKELIYTKTFKYDDKGNIIRKKVKNCDVKHYNAILENRVHELFKTEGFSNCEYICENEFYEDGKLKSFRDEIDQHIDLRAFYDAQKRISYEVLKDLITKEEYRREYVYIGNIEIGKMVTKNGTFIFKYKTSSDYRETETKFDKYGNINSVDELSTNYKEHKIFKNNKLIKSERIGFNLGSKIYREIIRPESNETFTERFEYKDGRVIKVFIS